MILPQNACDGMKRAYRLRMMNKQVTRVILSRVLRECAFELSIFKFFF